MKRMNYRRDLFLLLQGLLAFLLTMALLCLSSCGTGRRVTVSHEQTRHTQAEIHQDERAAHHTQGRSLAQWRTLTWQQQGGEWTLAFDSLVLHSAPRDGCTVVYGGRLSARDSTRTCSEHRAAQSVEISTADSLCTRTRTDLQADSRLSTREDTRRPSRWATWLFLLLVIAAGYGVWRRLKN